MTPFQYHFPHFLDIEKLNQSLASFGLSVHLFTDRYQNTTEHLIIENVKHDSNSNPNHRLVFSYGTFLMIHNSSLFTWQKFSEGLEICQYNLAQHDIKTSMQSEFVNVLDLTPGRHPHPTPLQYDHFITFIRKENLITPDASFEKYVIVVLHEQNMTIIPFDDFNETGGDPMYKWPALASLDLTTGKIHGIGMRMGTFTIQMQI